MSRLLTQSELEYHLSSLRTILKDFDYSSLKNIRFINLESLYNYMDTVENNPFKRQYSALQQELDFLQPYLPFTSSDRAANFLNEMSTANNDDEVENIKKSYTQKLRMDFLNLARTTTSDHDWDEVIRTCEEIRSHKEEMILVSQ
ncbi:MAG: hypothetical protein AB9856_10955 [Cellulosilyticaceae bacterium]